MTGDEWGYSFTTFLPGDIQPEKIVSAIHPGAGIPIIFGWIGKTHSDGDLAATIGFEYPVQTHQPTDKSGQELNDVNIFIRDSVEPERITLQPVTNPKDPPDVIAYVDGQPVGIEATQLLLPEVQLNPANSAIGRWSVFDRLRQKLVQESSIHDFAQHEGLLVVAYFGGYSGSPGDRLPPARAAVVDSVIAELKQMTPIVKPLVLGGQQNSVEAVPIRYSADQSVGFTWSKLPPGYGYLSPFYLKMKFELALGYHVTITLSDIKSELRRIIAAHDNPKADILLITVNASVKSGLWFPADQIVADLLFEDEQPLDGWSPSHVKRIALHDQQTFSRRDSGQHGRVRWIFGRSPWKWM